MADEEPSPVAAEPPVPVVVTPPEPASEPAPAAPEPSPPAPEPTRAPEPVSEAPSLSDPILKSEPVIDSGYKPSTPISDYKEYTPKSKPETKNYSDISGSETYNKIHAKSYQVDLERERLDRQKDRERDRDIERARDEAASRVYDHVFMNPALYKHDISPKLNPKLSARSRRAIRESYDIGSPYGMYGYSSSRAGPDGPSVVAAHGNQALRALLEV